MEKQALRERVWDELEESGVARFPFPPHGRIPNFEGADGAAHRLTDTDIWGQAEALKANPDSPQRPVRHRALEAGKVVYVAVPRLREAKCFLRLDPSEISDLDRATTISGSAELGTHVEPESMPTIDLVISGSVAVDEAGGRIGKGEGFSDLEFALLAELDLVGPETTVVTTVHERQVRTAEAPLPHDTHDVPIDLVVTPERSVETETAYDRPDGIDWEAISAEDIEEMPVLQGRR
jgi:5-formyltetrahydrofolate cyclo-ligase